MNFELKSGYILTPFENLTTKAQRHRENFFFDLNFYLFTFVFYLSFLI